MIELYVSIEGCVMDATNIIVGTNIYEDNISCAFRYLVYRSTTLDKVLHTQH